MPSSAAGREEQTTIAPLAEYERYARSLVMDTASGATRAMASSAAGCEEQTTIAPRAEYERYARSLAMDITPSVVVVTDEAHLRPEDDAITVPLPTPVPNTRVVAQPAPRTTARRAGARPTPAASRLRSAVYVTFLMAGCFGLGVFVHEAQRLAGPLVTFAKSTLVSGRP